MQVHVQIPINGEVITGELFIPESTSIACMVFCHGWTSKNTKYLKLAEQLARRGILCLAINLRGHGDSGYSIEDYSRKEHLVDVLAAIDYVKERSKNTPCILLGKSYGGYLSSIASSLRQIDYLILSQPALYPDAEFDSRNAELIRKNPDIFRSRIETIESNKALQAINSYKKHLLIVESEHDEEVFDTPKLYIKASEQNKNRTLATIKNSNHPLSRPEWLSDYYGVVISWIEKNLKLNKFKNFFNTLYYKIRI